MLRISLCAVFVSVAIGAGVDDTEKRRSEEILRAVAAAATADYEGLQQMKYQKETTGSKITTTMKTKTCVEGLKQALENEKQELQVSSQAEADILTHASAAVKGSQAKIAAQRQELQKVLHKALETTYMNIHNEYKRVRQSAEAMMTALHTEVSGRGCAGAKGSGTEIGVAAADGSNFNDCKVFDFGAGTGQEIFKQIVAATQKQLSPTDLDTFNKNGGFADNVANILKDLMLANAHDEVKEGANIDQTEQAIVESDLIKIASLLSGPDGQSNYDGTNSAANFVAEPTKAQIDAGTHSKDADSHPAGGHVSQALKGNQHGQPAGDDRRKQRANENAFERGRMHAIEKAFVAYVASKSTYHNTSTKKTALEAAKAMVEAKILAVNAAKTKLSGYTAELRGLEDDEMRKIHDIKEEFESLAADWLQLATYHCCDIVQGNAIECTDATAHLIAPINKVFPNALRQPDVQTDCTRRLL